MIAAGGHALPLPLPPRPPAPSSRSRRVRARYLRTVELWTIATHCVRSLNEMGGVLKARDPEPPRRVRAGRAGAGRSANSWADPFFLQIFDAGKRLRTGRREIPTGVRWVQALCRECLDAYQGGGDSSPYVPLVGALVSEPPEDAPIVDMLGALPAPIARLYADPVHILRPQCCASEMAEMNARYDRILGPRSEYISYLSRADVAPLWEWAPGDQAKGFCSSATVGKRDSEQLRKILMVCPFSWATETVALVGQPGYGLRGAAALQQVRAPSGCKGASADLSNAFTHIEVPTWMRPYQAGPRVQVRELPVGLVSKLWHPNSWLRPFYRRLPMGSTHAVFILMCINRVMLQKVNQMLRFTLRIDLLNYD